MTKPNVILATINLGRIRNKIRNLRKRIKRGYSEANCYIPGYEIARMEAQVDILKELLKEIEDDHRPRDND